MRIIALLLFFATTAHAQNLLDPIPFRQIGPSSPAGRAWQVIGDPKNPKVFYVTTADGGVWKTANAGTTLEPIFNDASAASTGAIAIDPSNSNNLWLGTGEPASTRANSLGNGVFHSTDGGKTWSSAGLTDSEEITAVVIDPRSSDTVYVAALGHLWGRNAERGIFKTTDAGRTWKKVLYIDDVTGMSDLAIDPHDPNVLYAAAWPRIRWGDGDMTESGTTGGIFKSTDSGATWRKLANGLPETGTAKITLSVAQHNSKIVYAAILTGEPAGKDRTIMTGGVFRSDDAGEHWTRVNPMMTSYYYDRIYADPTNDDRVWMPVFELMRSDDGGRTWVKHNMKHVHDDLHSIWIDPHDGERIVLGGDGGVNSSFDGGRTWIQHVLPIAQFYEIDVDNQDPYYVYAGMQDTGHWAGPNQTYDNEGITYDDWIKLRYNGDGMAIHVDPRDPNVIFMVQEFGNTSRLDLKKWTRTELQPPASMAKQLGLHTFRWDWTPPMILDASNPNVLYLGSNYVYRCELTPHTPDDGYVDHQCKVISPDLSAQQEATPKGVYHSYGALFSLAQSPLDPKTLWAGADDGPLWISRDGGGKWERVDLDTQRPGGVISRIEPSRFATGTAYVAYDRHTLDDQRPYLFVTTDFGKTWKEITNDLPRHGQTFIIREDPGSADVLYAGTEFGLFVSLDRGAHWLRWKSNLPMAAVRAMVIEPRTGDLVVGTFGRAIWIANARPLRQLAEAMKNDAFLFEPPAATAFNVRYTYGATIEELNGDMFFRGDNPPYGGTITYWLKDGADKVQLMVRDAAGAVVRTLDGSGGRGLHQVQWDLETDAAKKEKTPDAGGDEPSLTLTEAQRARRVKPGTYTVTMTAGALTKTTTVEVRPEPDGVRTVLPARK